MRCTPIVMIGDNDAGAFDTYGQAGQDYGTRLLWTLLLLVPVLYVNQEMVLRLGAVTGVGHARLILERFGKFWGAFSLIDLFILNSLTLVTEFIGVTLAAGYLGLPKVPSVVLAAGVVIAAAFTGSFRRFERIAVAFCAGSLLLIPVYVMAHPHVPQMARGFVVPDMPGGSGQLATVMLLVIGIVGTTIAPWQLFFQQSYVIDKRITPRLMSYERADLWIGIVIVIIGGAAIMGAAAAAYAGTKGFGNFTDAAGLSAGLAAYAGKATGAGRAGGLADAAAGRTPPRAHVAGAADRDRLAAALPAEHHLQTQERTAHPRSDRQRHHRHRHHPAGSRHHSHGRRRRNRAHRPLASQWERRRPSGAASRPAIPRTRDPRRPLAHRRRPQPPVRDASTGSRPHRTGRPAKRAAPRACAVAIGIMPRVRKQYPEGKHLCAAQAL